MAEMVETANFGHSAQPAGVAVRNGRKWPKRTEWTAPNPGQMAGDIPPSGGRGIPASGSGAFPDSLQKLARSQGGWGMPTKPTASPGCAHARAIKADTTNATPNATSTRGCAWPSGPRCSTNPTAERYARVREAGRFNAFQRPLAPQYARAREAQTGHLKRPTTQYAHARVIRRRLDAH